MLRRERGVLILSDSWGGCSAEHCSQMDFWLASCFGFPERSPELQLNDFCYFSACVDQETAVTVTEGCLSLAGKAG